MSQKLSLLYPVVTNQSLSSSFNTAATVIRLDDNLSYQIDCTTTDSVGTFSVQGSNNYVPQSPSVNAPNAGTWADLNLGSVQPFVNAASTTILIDLNQLPFTAIRVAYTVTTAGTGTCTIVIAGKRLGG